MEFENFSSVKASTRRSAPVAISASTCASTFSTPASANATGIVAESVAPRLASTQTARGRHGDDHSPFPHAAQPSRTYGPAAGMTVTREEEYGMSVRTARLVVSDWCATDRQFSSNMSARSRLDRVFGQYAVEAYRAKDGSNTANPKTSRCVSNCQLSRRIQIGQRCAAPDV